MPRVAIVSDIRIYREGLALLLARQDGLEVAGQAGDAAGALRLAGSADIVLVDAGMPDAEALVRRLLGSCDGEAMPACPPCPSDPWVLLAAITLVDGEVDEIDCATWRRYARSDAEAWFKCTPYKEGIPGLEKSVSMLLVEDLDAGDSAPRATVAVTGEGGMPLALPAHFEVHPGETFGELMERVGDHRLRDPQTGEVRTLAALYEVAAVDPEAPVSRLADALAPLEGLPFGHPEESWTRARLNALVDPPAVKRLDRPQDVLEVEADEVRGVGRSALRERLRGRTVGDVAAMPQERFVAEMSEGLTGSRARDAGARAAKVWESARLAAGIGRAAGGGG